jgi:hypothetical protein
MALIEPTIVLPSAIGQATITISETCMNASSVGRTASCPFCGWDVEAIVEVGGRCEENSWEAGCDSEEETGTLTRVGGLFASCKTWPFDGENCEVLLTYA